MMTDTTNLPSRALSIRKNRCKAEGEAIADAARRCDAAVGAAVGAIPSLSTVWKLHDLIRALNSEGKDND